MKKIIQVSFLIIILLSIIYYRNDIVNWAVKQFFFSEGVTINKNNNYDLDYNFVNVQTTDNFYAKTKQHLYNIIFTGLNYGNTSFYFFCDYKECIDDVNEMSNNNSFTYINNFVHPFNSYRKLSIVITTYKKITINVEKTYLNIDIERINNKIKQIENNIITKDMNNTEKIKAFHDYIINNVSYDSDYIDNDLDDIYHRSHNAIGPLFYNKSLCGGYTDVMSVFLDQLNVPNYRISSEYHIWNLVNIDNNWLHLDLTWDDPITNGKPILIDEFFLIDTETLESYNTDYHKFNKEIFVETTYSQTNLIES